MYRGEPAQTIVGARKEHLFEVSRLRVCVSAIHRAFGLTVHRAIVFDVEGRDKLDTVLIESHRMAEVLNGVIRTAKRQIFRYQSNGFNGVPMGELWKDVNRLSVE